MFLNVKLFSNSSKSLIRVAFSNIYFAIICCLMFDYDDTLRDNYNLYGKDYPYSL